MKFIILIIAIIIVVLLIYRCWEIKQNEKTTRNTVDTYSTNAFRNFIEMWSCLGQIRPKQSNYTFCFHFKTCLQQLLFYYYC